jgi:hypothetical protein
MMFCPTGGSSRDPSSSLDNPNIADPPAGQRSRPDRALWLTSTMNLAIAGPMPSRWYVSWMSSAAPERFGRATASERRFVRDERPDLFVVSGDECQGIHGTTAAGEQVYRSRIERRDDRRHVVGMLLRGRLMVPSVFVLRSTPRGSHVTTVRSVKWRANVPETVRAHQRSDREHDWFRAGVVRADVVGRTAPTTSSVWVVGSLIVVVSTRRRFGHLDPPSLRSSIRLADDGWEVADQYPPATSW